MLPGEAALHCGLGAPETPENRVSEQPPRQDAGSRLCRWEGEEPLGQDKALHGSPGHCRELGGGGQRRGRREGGAPRSSWNWKPLPSQGKDREPWVSAEEGGTPSRVRERRSLQESRLLLGLGLSLTAGSTGTHYGETRPHNPGYTGSRLTVGTQRVLGGWESGGRKPERTGQ